VLIRSGLPATVTATRRHGTARRLDLTLDGGMAVEIDLAPEIAVSAGDRLTLAPTRWRIFFEDGRSTGGALVETGASARAAG
jgi:hypothetical protein